MTTRLEAWLEGSHVGYFAIGPAGGLVCVRRGCAGDSDLTVATPRWSRTRKAAANFLTNLLPDDQRARTRMAATHGPEGIAFAPIYDAVPVALYPQFNQDLAMRVAGARRPPAVTIEHWRKLARENNLEPDDTVDLAGGLATRIADLNDRAWDDLDADQAETLRTSIARAVLPLAKGQPG